jgi:hypothetical protein
MNVPASATCWARCLTTGISVLLSSCHAESNLPVHVPNGRTQVINVESLFLPPQVLVRAGDGGSVAILSATLPQSIRVWRRGQWSTVTLPDSLMFIVNAGFIGDSLWLYDAAAQRILIRGVDGPWRQILLPYLAPGYRQEVVGVLADGSIALLSTAPQRDEEPELTLVWLATPAAGVRILDSLDTTPSELRLSLSRGRSLRSEQPWQIRDLAILSSDRKSVVLLKQRSDNGRTDDGFAGIRIRRYSTPEYRLQESQLLLPRLRFDKRVLNNWLRAFLTDSLANAFGSRAKAESALASRLFIPDRFSAFEQVSALPNGLFFISRLVNAAGKTRWELWSVDEPRHLKLSFPAAPGFELQDTINGDLLWISRRQDGTPAKIIRTRFE